MLHIPEVSWQCPVQTLAKRKYVESITHRRLVHEDQCTGISRVIPDTNGMGVPNGAASRPEIHNQLH